MKDKRRAGGVSVRGMVLPGWEVRGSQRPWGTERSLFGALREQRPEWQAVADGVGVGGDPVDKRILSSWIPQGWLFVAWPGKRGMGRQEARVWPRQDAQVTWTRWNRGDGEGALDPTDADWLDVRWRERKPRLLI